MSTYYPPYTRPKPVKMEDYTQTRKWRFVYTSQVEDWQALSPADRSSGPFNTFTQSEIVEVKSGVFYKKADILRMVYRDQVPRGFVVTIDMLPSKVQNDDVLPCFKHGLMVESIGSLSTGYSWQGHLPMVHHYGVDHFPIVIQMPGDHNLKNKGKPWYLHNGDHWGGARGFGPSTSSFQNQASQLFPSQPRLPLQLLQTAGMRYDKIYLLDFWNDETSSMVLVSYEDHKDAKAVPWIGRKVGSSEALKNFEKSLPKIGVTTRYYSSDKSKQLVAVSWHRIGSILFTCKGKYYLGAMDEGRYFLSQLPDKCARVQTAFEMMKPRKVRTAIRQGLKVHRQGEWFFIPVGSLPDKIFKKDWTPQHALPQKDSRGENTHVATRGVMQRGNHYVKGQIRHVNELSGNHSGEHRVVRLQDTIHLAVCNTTLADWSTTGRGID